MKLVQFLKQVTANRHHRQHFRFNSTFFLGKLETPSGDNQLLARRRQQIRRAGQTLRLTASFIAELLEKGYSERSPLLVWLKVSPEFDGIRSDSRFTDLMRRVGLPQ